METYVDYHANESQRSFQEPDEKIVAVLGKYYVHHNHAAIDVNIELAKRLHALVWDTPGLGGFCAHMNTAHFELLTSCGEGKFQRVDRQIIRRTCQAAILVPNWRDSLGTLAEVRMCNELGLPVFEEMESLTAWAMPNAHEHVFLIREEGVTDRTGSYHDVLITRLQNRTCGPLTVEQLLFPFMKYLPNGDD